MSIGKWKFEEWAIVIIVVIIVIAISVYCIVFDGGLSKEHQRWGEVGSFIGALTGLLAFAGVLYSIKTNSKQVKIQEERNTFFQLLAQHHRQVDNMNYKTDENEILEGLRVFEYLEKKEVDLWVIYLVYIYIKNTDDINLIGENLAKEEMLSLVKEYYGDENFDYKIFKDKIIEKEHDLLNEYDNGKYNYNFAKVNELLIYSNKILRESAVFEMYKELDSKINHMIFLPVFILSKYISAKDYKIILEIMNYVANHIYQLQEHYLGQYFRTVYYLLDILDGFSNSKQYARIFRAQLSRYELILILFNAMGDNATKRTIELYLKYDIFNNLNMSDLKFSSSMTETALKDILILRLNSLSN